MVKPKKKLFTEALESVLLNIWGSNKDCLDERLLENTRRALVEIRGIYRFRGDFPGKYPSAIKFRLKENRAGYIAAFGQRHAYSTYAQLKMIEYINSNVIPRPEDNKKELVVTTLGAGSAIEMYGLCYFYNEQTKLLERLRVNLIEKESAWESNRNTVFEKVLKDIFPGLEVFQVNINADLTTDCVPKFADEYDNLAKTDILLIYNVLNEIHAKYAKSVWRNIDFITRICERPLLILLMEPSVPKARARVDWLRLILAQSSDIILDKAEEEFFFNYDPIRIDYEGTGNGLNDRLFGKVKALDDRRPPHFEKSLKRTHLACVIRPRSPIPMEQIWKQLTAIEYGRGVTGRFIRQSRPQLSFRDEFPNWDRLR
jgi:hypothetical protein